MDLHREIEILTPLVEKLRETEELRLKKEILLSHFRVKDAAVDTERWQSNHEDLDSQVVYFSLIAVQQAAHLFASQDDKKERELISKLIEIENFYSGIGGIVGYHLAVLKFLSFQESGNSEYSVPPKVNVRELDVGAVLDGICSLGEMGEIYVAGGLGSRLNLISSDKDQLPAAYLPFLGRTLLEGMVRDLQAREFIYYRLFKKMVVVPIAIMTSHEKNNDFRIREICKQRGWFGRGEENFLIFPQLSVPVIDLEGRWLMKAPLDPVVQPGGHGAIWLLAEKKGVFCWFERQEKSHFVVRQINNPLAALDGNLLLLVGVGGREKKAFGLVSCSRMQGAEEGMLVLKGDGDFKVLANIEYTKFLNKKQEPPSDYPANTNILFANLEAVRNGLKKNPLPGLLINMKNKFTCINSNNDTEERVGGCLESMMQSISEVFSASDKNSLPTFLLHHNKRDIISVTKRQCIDKEKLSGTPEGAFYDLLYYSHDLLKSICKVSMDDFCSKQHYMERGPSHLFLYHPALGPLYTIVEQKIIGGEIFTNSELQLEIADIIVEGLSLNGSLLVHANNIMGHIENERVVYSNNTGKCILKDVTVFNDGISRSASNCYWSNSIERREALRIRLLGHSEFYAEGITFYGDREIVVPDGERWVARQCGKEISFHVERAGWEWYYDSQICLKRE